MLRRIAHFGAYDHDSYGDLLFPHLVQHFLGGQFEVIPVSPSGRLTAWDDGS